jgi:biopolymer transport protein TolQ
MDPVVSDVVMNHSATDFTVVSLFFRADPVVKAVMFGLLAASVWSWAIIFEKYAVFARVRRKSDRFETIFWSGRPLDELYESLKEKPDHPLGRLFVAAMREWQRAFERNAATRGLAERVDRVMSVTMIRELTKLERHLLFLATVGAVSPFIGLFGTVWGIMNSFQAIAVSHDTNLAVVAPGIAEALFATALGLLAAIPAVIFYNKFNIDLGRIAARLEGFADEFSALLSRQLDEQR